ncbi:hypothetical protein GDO78_009408 [Eleutherodactylus coqui]|uniref:Uncharacterized protein n=1 Tax=Eleutherodactylus coqui TaxID=57060 RepID=A0A8J6F9F0_ELECQ|nr:hypothetical protein GDO78_009408 [Eleutherodactylus coqui]
MWTYPKTAASKTLSVKSRPLIMVNSPFWGARGTWWKQSGTNKAENTINLVIKTEPSGQVGVNALRKKKDFNSHSISSME